MFFEAGALFPLATAAPSPVELAGCVLAGLLAGMLAWLLSTSLYKVEDAFGRLPLHWMWWPALGGLAVGIGGYLQPRALGVGYDVIADLLQNHLAASVIVALLGCKALMWVIALGSGTSGGILAPLLMMGAGLGVVLAPYLPGAEASLWALVCMAGVLAGVLGAPLTAIVFAFGLTHDGDALLPLLLTTAVSYGFSVLTMRRSIMTEKIARRGFHIYREYGVDPLERKHVADLMTQQITTIDADMAIATATQQYFGAQQRHRGYPLVHGDRLLGIIERDTLLNAPATCTRCGELIQSDVKPMVAFAGETVRVAAARMATHGLERLPVVDNISNMRLIGIISRSDMLRPSEDIFTEELVRERLR
jgi:CBS domain-containing protein